jgi:thioredoxin reductase/Pyruvate/2-oxoacid:ferredoxin oxidoreductase delta subunit
LNLITILAVCVALAGLLSLLWIWQEKIQEVRGKQVIEEIREAKSRGTDRALAQYPQIDAQACIGCGTCISACPENQVLGLVDGIARVIHGSRCIGHGLCEVACPVDALTVGLGDIASRPDIPVLSSSLETTVPGVHIAGELGGFALIRHAIKQGAQAMETIAQETGRLKSPGLGDDVADVLIVGAGPAGFAATLKAAEHNLHYRTIDQEDVGGTVRKYPRRKLTLTGPMDLPLHGRVRKKEFVKEELIRLWEKIIRDHRLRMESGVKFLGVDRRDGVLVARTSEGPIAAKRILLALGRRGTPRQLGVPGEDAEKVLYQVVDTASYRDTDILVVGGGDSAIEAATGLANQPGNVVTLSYRRERFFRLKARNRERIEGYARDGRVRVVFNSEVKCIESDAVTLSVQEDGIERGSQIRNDYVFVLAGGEPPYELLRGMGVEFGGEPVVPSVKPEVVRK